tara:strand:- start:167 stop:664 length:498 start_codon:yes stop_codon:yes gene_type:complete
MKKFIAVILILAFNSTIVAAELKIGFIEIKKILQNAPQTAKANKILEKEFTKRTKKLKATVKKINEKETAFKKDSMTMSDADKAKKIKAIKKLKIEAQKTERGVREDIDLRRKEEIANVQSLVNIAVEKVAKEQSYDLILYQGVAFAGKKVDITDVVLKALGKTK